MARNRMVNVSFWSSKRLNRVSIESNLFYIGLMNQADDYGVLENIPRQIWGNVFPLREDVTVKHCTKWIDELVGAGLLMSVEHNGKSLLMFYKWSDYQKVTNPSKRRFILDEIQTALYRDYLESNESIYRLGTCNKNKNIKENKKEKDEEEKSKPKKNPEFAEVREHFVLKGSDANEAKKFFDWCVDGDWKDSTGKKITAWKRNASGWIGRNKKTESGKTIPFHRQADADLAAREREAVRRRRNESQ